MINQNILVDLINTLTKLCDSLEEIMWLHKLKIQICNLTLLELFYVSTYYK